MPKRSHDQFKEVPSAESHESLKALAQRERVHGLLHNGKTNIFRALKVARGFERQKLGRRQKNATKEKKDDESQRIKEEVDVLKKLELEKVAEVYLYKTVLKVKSVVTSGLLPDSVEKKVENEKKRKPDAATLNVLARLYNSTPVKTSVNEIVDRIRECAGLGAEGQFSKEKTTQDTRTSAAPSKTKVRSRSNSIEPVVKEQTPSDRVSQSSDLEDLSLSEEDGLDPNLIRQFQIRVASSDEEDDDDDVVDQKRRTIADWSGSDSAEGVDDEATSDSETGPEPKGNKVTKPTKPPKPPIGATSSTTFLPTLSIGGYFSGSDDEDSASDLEPETKRNRRGQRARRAILEKKFGKNANHVRRAADDRRSGWDLRKGAQPDDGDDRASGMKKRKATAWKVADYGERKGRGPQSSGANTEPVVANNRVTGVKTERGKDANGGNGKVHPSWEAARKAKEAKKVVVGQGKKMTFD